MLADLGYHATTMPELFEAWHGGPPLREKPMVLSFDDGDGSHRHAALPILRDRGLRGY
jgi:peptidoglycan/xylan/chitin deacetylase (PgdA/CDA1 family)